NGWAQSTDTRRTTPGDILQRAAGFGLEVSHIRDNDPALLYQHLAKVVERVRQGRPLLQIIDTRRFLAPSKGDDNPSQELMDELWRDDPLSRMLATDPLAQKFATAGETAVEEVIQTVARRTAIGWSDQPAMAPSALTLSRTSLHAETQTGKKYGRIADELNRAL